MPKTTGTGPVSAPGGMRPIGYIQLVFFDDANNAVVPLGGMGFLTQQEGDAAWANIPEFTGEGSFQADRLDSIGDIVAERSVSAELCQRLTGTPIAVLIEQGRKALAQELTTRLESTTGN